MNGGLGALPCKRLTFERQLLPLRNPYRLSLATIDAFESFFVTAVTKGRSGTCEITPFPEYGGETAALAARAIADVVQDLSDGVTPEAAWGGIYDSTPMTASGIACAFELADGRIENWPPQPGELSVPVAAAIDPHSPTWRGQLKQAITGGHSAVKIKLGVGSRSNDIEIARALASEMPGDVELRLDVNQCYSAAEAAAFLKSVPAAPNLFLEQPLPPGAWTEIAELAAQFSHRIVLDESIWTLADAQRAAAARVDRIKLKLCKHGGYLEMCNIARFAMESGLSVILGNGVQSAVGNALEAHAHSALGLAAAAECNGFARLADAQACAYISMSDDGRVKS